MSTITAARIATSSTMRPLKTSRVVCLTRDKELASLKKQKKLAGDLPSLELWCRRRDPRLEPSWSIHDELNSPFNAEVKSLVGMDNEGAMVRLSSLEFVNYDKTGKGTLAKFTDAKGGSVIALERRKYRFFLLSSNQSLLARIVPVWRVSADHAKRLEKSLQEATEQIRGTVHTRCAASDCKTGWMKREKQYVAPASPLEPVSTIYADTDHDGNPDLLAGLRAVDKKAAYAPLTWQGMAIMRLGKEPWVRAEVQFVNEVALTAVDLNAGSIYLPKIVVQTTACTYLMTSSNIAYQPMDLFAMPEAGTDCRHRQADKTHEKID